MAPIVKKKKSYQMNESCVTTNLAQSSTPHTQHDTPLAQTQ